MKRIIERLYEELPEFKKKRLRKAWVAENPNSESSVWYRMRHPKIRDAVFFSSVFNVPLEDIAKEYFQTKATPTVLLSEEENIAAKYGLTRIGV